jgi:hypothetical protein
MSCLYCSVRQSRSRCTGPGRHLKTILGKESLYSHCVLFLVSVPYILPSATASFKLRPPSTPLPIPEKGFSVVSTEEMTLIGRISDVVLSGHGPEFVV